MVFRIDSVVSNGTEFRKFKYLLPKMQSDRTATFSKHRHATSILKPRDTSDLNDKCLQLIVGTVGRINCEPF